MIRRLLTNIKIPFADPYVVRLLHEDTLDLQPLFFRNYTQKIYKNTFRSWGYSSPAFEMLKNPNYDKKNTNWTANPEYISYLYSYWCFIDELDALQFRLSIPEKAIHMVLWPSNKLFTIHEIVE